MKIRQIVTLECGFSWPPDLLTYGVADSFGIA